MIDFDRVGRQLWTVETDLPTVHAQELSGVSGWYQGGRLGTELTADHATAMDATQRLLAALAPHPAAVVPPDHKVLMSPQRGQREIAVDGLHMYRAGRARLVECIHAAMEAGMKVPEIAKESGLSRQGVDKIIDRRENKLRLVVAQR